MSLRNFVPRPPAIWDPAWFVSFYREVLSKPVSGLFDDPVQTPEYTVAQLASINAVRGMRVYVTDASAPSWNGTLTGGGAVKCPAHYNGTAWVAG